MANVNVMQTLQHLEQKKQRLEDELRMVEKQVYDLETSYLNDSNQNGNVLKGFEGYLAPTKTQNMKKGRSFKIEDRMFSLSSTTSQAAEELAIANAEAQVGTQRQKGQPGRPPRQYQD